MIISERRNFIFLHNPKCAGTSVRTALAEFDTTGEFFWRFDTWNGKEIDKAHMPLFVFRSRYPDYFKLMETYLSFMFVRNPYDRTVSAFNEVQRKLMPTSDSVEQDEGYAKSLNDFIGNMNEGSLRKNLFKYRHFVKQADLAYLGSKRLVDIIMKVEDWPDCLSPLEVFLPDVTHKMRAGQKRNVKPLKKDHRSYLSPEAIKKINVLYQNDFDLFGYARL